MRKDWIRTEEETKLRQLQKLVKEQRKFNILTDEQQPLVNLPIVARKKKRLLIKPIIQELVVNPVNTNVQIILIVFCLLYRSLHKHFLVLIVI
jgi:hypothetical protein